MAKKKKLMAIGPYFDYKKSSQVPFLEAHCSDAHESKRNFVVSMRNPRLSGAT